MKSFPKFTLPAAPGAIPPPPALPAQPDPFPTPWIVGPYGDIWVAADITPDETRSGGWRETVPGQTVRVVVRMDHWPEGLAQRIVDAVNATNKQGVA